jgi:hypothetical protein
MHVLLHVPRGRVTRPAGMVVLRLGLRWRTPAEAVREPAGVVPAAHSEVIFSVSARVSDGPVRNGEPSRVHSVLHGPMVVSAKALSRASPTVPIDGARPASISVSVKWTLVYRAGYRSKPE